MKFRFANPWSSTTRDHPQDLLIKKLENCDDGRDIFDLCLWILAEAGNHRFVAEVEKRLDTIHQSWLEKEEAKARVRQAKKEATELAGKIRLRKELATSRKKKTSKKKAKK